MSKKLAIDGYLGLNNQKRLNCVQTILGAFKDAGKFNFVDEQMIDSFSSFGGGRAPEGVCGAYYSAVQLLSKVQDFEAVKKFETEFFEKFKTSKCKDLKANKISCIDAIGFCGEFLEKNN